MIWGNEAVNGVALITIKKGNRKTNGGKPRKCQFSDYRRPAMLTLPKRNEKRERKWWIKILKWTEPIQRLDRKLTSSGKSSMISTCMHFSCTRICIGGWPTEGFVATEVGSWQKGRHEVPRGTSLFTCGRRCFQIRVKIYVNIFQNYGRVYFEMSTSQNEVYQSGKYVSNINWRSLP